MNNCPSCGGYVDQVKEEKEGYGSYDYIYSEYVCNDCGDVYSTEYNTMEQETIIKYKGNKED